MRLGYLGSPMGFVARVLVVGGNARKTGDLARKLSRRGYTSLIAQSSSEAMPIAVNGHADIVLADPASAGDLTELTAALSRRGHKHMPLVLLGGGETGTAALPVNCTDAELFSRLDSLVRLNTMQEELNRRIATAEKFGLATPPLADAVDVDNAMILLVAGDDNDQKELTDVFRDVATLVRAPDNFAAMELLTSQNFDAVVIAADPDAARQLGGDIRINSRLYNTPILVIVDGESIAAEAIYSSGANEVVRRPWAIGDIQSRALALVRQHRYRMQMRRIYREALRPTTSDSLTGLYNHGFLHEHLAQQIVASRQGGKSLTLGVLDIDGLARINHRYGYAGGDRLLAQVGALVGSLVRGEDLSARFGGGTFCVVLPDAAPEVAFFALHRIAGVVDHTEFALLDPDQPVSIRIKVGAAGLQPGDDAESLIARALAVMV